MRYRVDVDPFIDKQPPVEFLDDLTRPMHNDTPVHWNKRSKDENEVFIPAAKLITDFPDPENVLETAYEDFLLFLKVSLMEDGDFIFQVQLQESYEQEEYSIEVSETKCIVSAGDTEGVRRGLFFIEDEMNRREGSFLPLGVIRRKAVLKTRISRCFFSPHYQTNGAGELADDTDYYPDSYLNRLAHDGVNGLWIQEHFRKLLPSDVIPEYGKESKERLERLNRVIQKCKRYGIRIYLEGVEPASTYNNPDLKNHPEILGQAFGEHNAFCPSTLKGQEYIRESIKKLFTLVPDLAGLITISVGESVATCAGVEVGEFSCPHCLETGLSKAEILANCENIMADALSEVKPEAELISWTYAMRTWEFEEALEYFNVRSDKTINMTNFEDLGTPIQLGKPRLAYDYWLSYTGPGELFTSAAEIGESRNTPVYAKIQVCNSHEVASVPYVPVPGILYDKFRYMHEHNITGVLYCWYFGNYPSLMNKAASELSFTPFFKTKQEFLEYLASIYWGKDARKVAEAWQCFEDGYSQYPVNVAFEWYGPMADGPVWPLHLKPVDLPCTRTWEAVNMVGSDRLGEFMLMGHTHGEALTLCQDMSRNWKQGKQLLEELDSRGEHIRKEQQSVAKALDCLFESGANIIKFYYLRNLLGFLEGDALQILDEMEEIVRQEMQISKTLSMLCEMDKRLGYHSEARGYKFFPDKLQWRIAELEKLLETEFPEVRERVKANKVPLEFYWGLSEDSRRYCITEENINNANWEPFMYQDGSIENKTRVRMSENDKEYILQIAMNGDDDILIKPEFLMFHPYVPVKLQKDGKISFVYEKAYSVFGKRKEEEFSKWKSTKTSTDDGFLWEVTLNKRDFDLEKKIPFRLDISRLGERTSMWEKGDRFYERLIFGNYSPDSYVFIVPRGVIE